MIGTPYQPAVATGNGVTVAFSFPWPLQDASQVGVELDGVPTSTGFVATLNPDQEAAPGGSVTFATAPASGVVVALQAAAPFQRTQDFQSGFNADTLDADQDYQTILLKELRSDLDRVGVVNPRYGVLGPLSMPRLADGLLKWNAAGSNFEAVTAQSLLGFSVTVNSVSVFVNTMSAMKALAAGVQTYVYVGGYYATGDLGGGLFYWDAASSTADDGGMFIQPNSLPASGRWRRIYEGMLNVRYFGAKGDGATNDTTTIMAAINYAHTNKIGNVWFPAGTYAITSLAKQWTGLTGGVRRSVNLIGAGSKAVFFTKFSGAAPMIDFSTDTAGSTELYSRMEGFSIEGSGKTYDGIKLTDAAYLELHDVNIQGCDKGLHLLGCLVSIGRGVRIRNNNIGAYIRKSAFGNRPNQLTFDGQSVINSNSTLGIDYGDGAMLRLGDVNMEFNGTSADLTTGAVFIRDTIDDDVSVSYGQIELAGVWFESNLGRTFQATGGANLVLSMRTVKFIGDEGGRAVVIPSTGNYIDMNNVVAVGAGIISIAGNASTLTNVICVTLTDTCTERIYKNVYTGSFNGGLRARRYVLTDGIAAPSTEAGWAQQYVDTADGDLKERFGDGFTRTIGVDS